MILQHYTHYPHPNRYFYNDAIASRSTGEVDNGEVKIKKLLSYDLVENPAFSDANFGYIPNKPKEIKPNLHPDIDPYGEENWDDDEIQPRFNLNLLPIAQKIASRTIGLDIVAVKPMSSPKFDLMWLDFKYGEIEEDKPKGKVIISELDPYGEENWD